MRPWEAVHRVVELREMTAVGAVQVGAPGQLL